MTTYTVTKRTLAARLGTAINSSKNSLVKLTEWPPIGKIAAHSAYEMFSWYTGEYLIVSLVFSHLGFWSGSLFLIAPFPDLCLLVLFYVLRCRRYGNTMMNTNNDLKLSSLELCKNSKEEVGPDRSVSSNKFSSVTLNKLAMNR